MTLLCLLQSTLFFASDAPVNTNPKKLFELIRSRNYNTTDTAFKEGLAILYSVIQDICMIKIYVDRVLPENCNNIKALAKILGIEIIENTKSNVISRVFLHKSMEAKLIEELFKLMAYKRTSIEYSIIDNNELFITEVSTLRKHMSHLSIFIDPQNCFLPTDNEKLKELAEKLGFIPVSNSTLNFKKNPFETCKKELSNIEIPLDVNQLLKDLPQINNKRDEQINDSPLSYEKRAILSINAATAKLFRLMEEKKSNIGISFINIDSFESLLQITPHIAPYICLIKIPIEECKDFSFEKINNLKKLAEQCNVMILHDSKFADSSETVKAKYTGAHYNIATWADFVTVHPVESLFEFLKNLEMALQGAGITEPRGALAITQTLGLLTPDYTKTVLRAVKHCSSHPVLAGITHVSYMPTMQGHIKVQREEIPLQGNGGAKQFTKSIKKGSKHDISFCTLDPKKDIPVDTLRSLQKSSWNVYTKSLMNN